jgi:hypothetical protein
MAAVSRYRLVRGWKISCGGGRVSRGRQEYRLSLAAPLSPRRTAWHRGALYSRAAASTTARTAGHPLAMPGPGRTGARICYGPVDPTASGVPYPQTIWHFFLRLSCQPPSGHLGMGPPKTCASRPPAGIIRVSVVIGCLAASPLSSFHSHSRHWLPDSCGYPGRVQTTGRDGPKSSPSQGRNSGRRQPRMPDAE